jgi:hypothetical protein
MNAFVPYLAALHQQDLLDEARRMRRARQVQLANPSTRAWRRTLGAAAQGLSNAFASAARTIDPAIDCVDAASA